MADEQLPPQPQDAGPQDTPPPPEAAPEMDMGGYLSRAWNLVIGDFVLLVLGWVVVALIMGVPLVGFVIGGPLMLGYVRVVQKRINGEPAEFGEIFKGFQDFGKGFLTLLLQALVGLGVSIPIIVVAVVLSFVPCAGVVLTVVVAFAGFVVMHTFLFFVWQIAALTDASPTDALSQSFRFAMANFGPMFLLALVVGLVGAAGSLVCLGHFFTVPIAIAAGVYAYNEYFLPKAQDAV